jgi:hypothetical protein
VHLLHALWTCLHWPFCPGVFISILGFSAAVVTFWEKPPKLAKGLGVALFFALMCGEIAMMGVDRDKHDQVEEEARKAAGQQATINDLLVGQLSDASNKLSGLDKKINDAKGNPQLIATLESQASQARAQKDAATHQLLLANAGSKQLLLTVLSGVVQEMKDWEQKWHVDNDLIEQEIQKYVTDKGYFRARGSDPDAKIAELKVKQLSRNAEYSRQVRTLLTNANYLREQLLQGSQPNDGCKPADAIFAKSLAGETLNYTGMLFVTSCTEILAKRFASSSAPDQH